MKPLQLVATGYVVLAVYARLGGTDLVADPVGWLLVLLGVRRLPDPVSRPVLVAGAVVGLLISVPLVVPDVAAAVEVEDPALAWAASLPSFGFLLLLLLHLLRSAAAADDSRAVTSMRLLAAATVVVAAAPVLVLGAGWTAAGPTAASAAVLWHVVVIVALLRWSGRPWSQAEPAEPAERPGRPTRQEHE